MVSVNRLKKLEDIIFRENKELTFLVAERLGDGKYLINDEIITDAEFKELEDQEMVRVIFIEWG